LALSFAAPGVQLVLLARDEAKLASVAAACRERGSAVELVAASVTDKARMESELLRLDALFQFDCVIANAGVSKSVAIGSIVVLDGSQSRMVGVSNAQLYYQWTQESGWLWPIKSRWLSPGH
jgi:NADP-dependent 3-hydroxy acid dehydrogenase YdfG